MSQNTRKYYRLYHKPSGEYFSAGYNAHGVEMLLKEIKQHLIFMGYKKPKFKSIKTLRRHFKGGVLVESSREPFGEKE